MAPVSREYILPRPRRININRRVQLSPISSHMRRLAASLNSTPTFGSPSLYQLPEIKFKILDQCLLYNLIDEFSVECNFLIFELTCEDSVVLGRCFTEISECPLMKTRVCGFGQANSRLQFEEAHSMIIKVYCSQDFNLLNLVYSILAQEPINLVVSP